MNLPKISFIWGADFVAFIPHFLWQFSRESWEKWRSLLCALNVYHKCTSTTWNKPELWLRALTIAQHRYKGPELRTAGPGASQSFNSTIWMHFWFQLKVFQFSWVIDLKQRRCVFVPKIKGGWPISPINSFLANRTPGVCLEPTKREAALDGATQPSFRKRANRQGRGRAVRPEKLKNGQICHFGHFQSISYKYDRLIKNEANKASNRFISGHLSFKWKI